MESQTRKFLYHGNVKVDSNLVKAGDLFCQYRDSNPKLEYRNTKQFQNPNIKWSKHSEHLYNLYRMLRFFNFGFWSFVFISDFVLRISNLQKI